MVSLTGKVILQRKSTIASDDYPQILEIVGEEFGREDGGMRDGYHDDIFIAFTDYAKVKVSVYYSPDYSDQTWGNLEIESEYYELAPDGDQLEL